MGQKVHPIGLRLGIIEDWRSKWYEDKNYAKWLHEDLKIRAHVREKYKQAGISRVEIKRSWKKAEVSVHSAKPGVLIGKKGQGVDLLKLELQKITSANVLLNIVEVRKAELDAQLVADMKRNFTSVKHAKPPSSRKGSVEWFVVAQGFKGRQAD